MKPRKKNTHNILTESVSHMFECVAIDAVCFYIVHTRVHTRFFNTDNENARKCSVRNQEQLFEAKRTKHSKLVQRDSNALHKCVIDDRIFFYSLSIVLFEQTNK